MERASILIVVEEPGLLLHLNTIVSSTSPECDIFLAESSLTARDYLARRNFQLVILTERNLDLARFIRDEKSGSKHSKMLLLTEYGKKFFKSVPEKFGINYYLNIPFSPEEFKQLYLKIYVGIARKINPGEQFERESEEALNMLAEFRKTVDARCVFISDSNGSILCTDGKSEKLELSVVAPLLSGGIATIGEVGNQLDGGEASTSFVYQEGKDFSTYALNIGKKYILNIVMDKTENNNKVGIIWYYARPLSQKLEKVLAPDEALKQKSFIETEINKKVLLELDKVFSNSNDLQGR